MTRRTQLMGRLAHILWLQAPSRVRSELRDRHDELMLKRLRADLALDDIEMAELAVAIGDEFRVRVRTTDLSACAVDIARGATVGDVLRFIERDAR